MCVCVCVCVVLCRLKARERGFYLDGVALSRQVNEETGRSHPAPSFGIPQYRSSQDKHCRQYFTSKVWVCVAAGDSKNHLRTMIVGTLEQNFHS